MNHLKNQTSPYLLQHAENPVEWYPWCEEAFERAKKEDKPIFLSIGYSTCHWCHVMAEECFEDQDVADLLNHGFISIKVDREERPDLDAVYMAACQAMTGNGGWPMSIFMTAEQKPFFTGTYFPKHSRSGMTGFKDILTYIADVWKSNRSRLLNAAETLHLHLKNMEKRRDCDTLDYETGRKLLNQGVLQLKKQFDREYGGFGAAPKFPMPHNLMFLMQQYEERGDKALLQIAEKTLMQMYKGGIFDHLGGGFSRYSTDRYFLIPHFEKMLYDNVLLIAAYCRGYDLTRKQIYLDAAEHTAQWILREMQGGHGGFYSAQDADSQGEEGLFYVFSYGEIIQLLGPIDGRNFASHYGMTEDGYFEGKNLIYIMVEAFDYIAIDPVLTPTLYMMQQEGWDFQNYFTPKYSCTTGESEFIGLTSLVPSSSVCTPNTERYTPLLLLFLIRRLSEEIDTVPTLKSPSVASITRLLAPFIKYLSARS